MTTTSSSSSKVSLFSYILDQHTNPNQQGFLDALYGAGSQSVKEQALNCKAIYQSLSELSKNYIMRLLFLGDKEFALKDLAAWVYSTETDAHLAAIQQLTRHRILVRADTKPSEKKKRGAAYIYRMNPFFTISFKYSLTSPFNPMQLVPHSHQHNLESIEHKCAERWNNLLNLLIHPERSGSKQADQTALAFFRREKLIGRLRGGGSREEITAKGYEYILKNKASQLWLFVYEKLMTMRNSADADGKGDSSAEVLSLLFKLAYCEYGQWYILGKDLTKPQKELLKEFAELGIIAIERSGCGEDRGKAQGQIKFFPTKVAIEMIYDSSLGSSYASKTREVQASTTAGELMLITETTFQVTAYLTSDLHYEMIQLFLDIEVRMPGMTMGRITREKAHSAFRKNITAPQIIDFLQMYAHPLAKANDPIVPENVTDQLVLWENETKRIDAALVTLYDTHKLYGDEYAVISYQKLKDIAIQCQGLVWFNDNSALLAVKQDIAEVLEDEMRSW
jgi:transcription initiation factor TFIIH subunit 4